MKPKPQTKYEPPKEMAESNPLETECATMEIICQRATIMTPVLDDILHHRFGPLATREEEEEVFFEVFLN